MFRIKFKYHKTDIENKAFETAEEAIDYLNDIICEHDDQGLSFDDFDIIEGETRTVSFDVDDV